MIGFLRRLFEPAQTEYIAADEIVDRVVRHPEPKLRRFKCEGKIIKVWDGPDEVLAYGECVKEAESAESLKAAWERDMRIVFPMGADYNVEYHCTVTPLDDESEGEAEVLAAAAVAGTVSMF